MAEINKGGRPRHGAEPKSSSLNLKTTAEVRAQLEAAASASRRSLTQEVERRLIDSLEAKGPIPSDTTATLLRSIATAIGIIESEDGHAWTEDYETFTAVEAAIAQLVDRRNPGYPPDEIERMAELGQRHRVEMKAYNTALAAYELAHPDCPRLPAVHGQWLAEDRRFSEAATRGDEVAERIIPRPRRHHMSLAVPGGTKD